MSCWTFTISLERTLLRNFGGLEGSGPERHRTEEPTAHCGVVGSATGRMAAVVLFILGMWLLVLLVVAGAATRIKQLPTR